MRVALAAGLLMSLAACTQPPMERERPPAPSDACGASKFQGLVGQPRQALTAISLPEASRVIGPDMAVTADYSPDRLNVEYDAAGVILRISCY